VTRLRKRALEQGRTDDTEDAIRHRQDVFARETAPLIPVFRERGLLIEVDGLGDIDEVAGRIAAALDARGLSARDAAVS
jgi:adenylate kinase